MQSQDVPPIPLTNLTALNNALMRLKPGISGIDLTMLETKGANRLMLDLVITACHTGLYNSMKRGEVLAALKPLLAARVNTHPITYTYDVHGDKHFDGGPQGTKFEGTKAHVNPLLTALIAPHVGRIRRHANGKVQTYYLTEPVQTYTRGQQLAIQVDYTPGPPDNIGFHGYPRDVNAYVLSTTLAGPPIPM